MFLGERQGAALCTLLCQASPHPWPPPGVAASGPDLLGERRQLWGPGQAKGWLPHAPRPRTRRPSRWIRERAPVTCPPENSESGFSIKLGFSREQHLGGRHLHHLKFPEPASDPGTFWLHLPPMGQSLREHPACCSAPSPQGAPSSTRLFPTCSRSCPLPQAQLLPWAPHDLAALRGLPTAWFLPRLSGCDPLAPFLLRNLACEQPQPCPAQGTAGPSVSLGVGLAPPATPLATESFCDARDMWRASAVRAGPAGPPDLQVLTGRITAALS